jgi:hypothetical protein
MSGSRIDPDTQRRRANRWRRWLVNLLLLPPAILYVLVENVFWAGAKAMLRAAARLDAVNAVQRGLKKLPAWAVLPLFIIPEIFSHVGGFWATYLLVHRKWAAAMTVGIVIKGIATLATVWIYQSCEPALLSVKWFAWVHGKAIQGRDWVADRTKPLRQFARRLVTGSRLRLTRRFRLIRGLVASRFGMPGK